MLVTWLSAILSVLPKKVLFLSKGIIDFCDHFVSDFPSAYCWVGLKPFGILL